MSFLLNWSEEILESKQQNLYHKILNCPIARIHTKNQIIVTTISKFLAVQDQYNLQQNKSLSVWCLKFAKSIKCEFTVFYFDFSSVCILSLLVSKKCGSIIFLLRNVSSCANHVCLGSILMCLWQNSIDISKW